ncbi:hypothetical protein [Amycolatopsis sp. NPDC059657]|uniref:hypothetical protein n=1 Tax=Amycolatopsis sp. NPDC059657 TaxID=3346899 RepID=UPI00366E7DD3
MGTTPAGETLVQLFDGSPAFPALVGDERWHGFCQPRLRHQVAQDLARWLNLSHATTGFPAIATAVLTEHELTLYEYDDREPTVVTADSDGRFLLTGWSWMPADTDSPVALPTIPVATDVTVTLSVTCGEERFCSFRAVLADLFDEYGHVIPRVHPDHILDVCGDLNTVAYFRHDARLLRFRGSTLVQEDTTDPDAAVVIDRDADGLYPLPGYRCHLDPNT